MHTAKLPSGLAILLLTGCDAGSPLGPEQTTPDFSSTAAVAGICHGVLNQIEHRGFAEPNLLAAAARQNAEVIQQLQTQRIPLENQRSALQSQLASEVNAVAGLTAAIPPLQQEIAALYFVLTQDPTLGVGPLRDLLEEQRLQKEALLAQYQNELAIREGIIAQLQAQTGSLTAQIEAIDAQIARGGC